MWALNCLKLSLYLFDLYYAYIYKHTHTKRRACMQVMCLRALCHFDASARNFSRQGRIPRGWNSNTESVPRSAKTTETTDSGASYYKSTCIHVCIHIQKHKAKGMYPGNRLVSSMELWCFIPQLQSTWVNASRINLKDEPNRFHIQSIRWFLDPSFHN